MQLPIPTHLKEILNPIGVENDEFMVCGQLKCSCGSENFEIHFVGDDSDYEKDKVIKVLGIEGGYFLIVKVKCLQCKNEYSVFDSDYHGWNGFVCGGDNRDKERPSTKMWHCHECSGTDHKVILTINSQGKDDFIEEGGVDFSQEDWVDAFEWITMETDCAKCGTRNPEWISYETM